MSYVDKAVLRNLGARAKKKFWGPYQKHWDDIFKTNIKFRSNAVLYLGFSKDLD
jgi:hypothetical protein